MKTYLYFFFKAEDGIRDADVTGVQTCALPIYTTRAANPSRTTCSPARSASRPRSSCRRPSRRASAGCRKSRSAGLDFFERQEQARRPTRWLAVWYALGVLSLVASFFHFAALFRVPLQIYLAIAA